MYRLLEYPQKGGRRERQSLPHPFCLSLKSIPQPTVTISLRDSKFFVGRYASFLKRFRVAGVIGKILRERRSAGVVYELLGRSSFSNWRGDRAKRRTTTSRNTTRLVGKLTLICWAEDSNLAVRSFGFIVGMSILGSQSLDLM